MERKYTCYLKYTRKIPFTKGSKDFWKTINKTVENKNNIPVLEAKNGYQAITDQEKCEICRSI